MLFPLFSSFFRKADTRLPNTSDTPAIVETHRHETVKNLLEKPQYGETVKLTGKIETFLGGNRYLFSDETGRIAVRVSLRVLGETALFKTSRIAILGDLKRTLSGSHILRAQYLKVLYY